MLEHRNVGDMMIALGRLTQDDVDRALAHQRAEGGYFGEALLALDLVSRQELDWVLASQLDLPYVVPSVEEVDLSVARLVTREWAIAHSALPILRTDTSLRVVVAAPNQEALALSTLAKRVGLEVEPAMASSEAIAELVRAVFTPPEERRVAVVPSRIADFIDEAFLTEAARFGVSAEGYRATGWYESKGRTVRIDLDARWRQDLSRMLVPPLADPGGGPLRTWMADLLVGGAVFGVRARELQTHGGVEVLFRPLPADRETHGVTAPGVELLSEVAVIVASGAGKFRVTPPQETTAATLIAQLPTLLLDRSLRRIHLTDRAGDEQSGSVMLPADREQRDSLLSSLTDFAFDVVTADLGARDADLTVRLCQLAHTSFVSAQPHETDADAFRAGLRWDLTVQQGPADLEWSLAPLRP